MSAREWFGWVALIMFGNLMTLTLQAYATTWAKGRGLWFAIWLAFGMLAVTGCVAVWGLS